MENKALLYDVRRHPLNSVAVSTQTILQLPEINNSLSRNQILEFVVGKLLENTNTSSALGHMYSGISPSSSGLEKGMTGGSLMNDLYDIVMFGLKGLSDSRLDGLVDRVSLAKDSRSLDDIRLLASLSSKISPNLVQVDRQDRETLNRKDVNNYQFDSTLDRESLIDSLLN